MTDQPWLVVAAAILALASTVIVLTWHRRIDRDQSTNAELTAEAEHLARENDQALARAARFEAEAIQARAQLAEAMRRDQEAQAAAAATAEAQVEPTDEDADAETEADADDAAETATEPPTIDLARRIPLPRFDLVAGATDLITDPATGLFSQVFFDASLVKRISAARRGLRPLSVAVAEVATAVGTPELAPAPAGPVATIMVSVFREADTLARGDDGRFMILLEDTPENGAIWTLERLRRRISEELPGHTLWVGLSCYPAYGFDADQLIAQARAALGSAKEWQQDRIEVTTASPDEQ